MYIGQMGTNPWLKTSWLNQIGCRQSSPALSSVGSQEQTRTNTANRDRLELSSSYLRFPNRLKVLETPEATPVNATLDISAELLPASEEEQYTEEDALMNQYMKQYRLDFVKIGDSFELDPSKPVKLMTEGQVSQESLDAFRAQLEENGLGEEIDWRGVQEDFLHMDLRFDNAQRFETKADYLASRYAVLKDRIQTQYTGDKLEQEMQTLDTLYTKAKEELADSYAANIGGFYEGLGQSGASEDMRESVLAAIDGKAEQYSAYLAEHDIYADITDPSKQWLKQDDGYMAARLRESAATSQADATTQAVDDSAPYSTEDLGFAAVYAKGLSEQIRKPEWDTYEIKDSDADLGQSLARQYQSLSGAMEDAGISDQMSDLLKDAFEPFIDKFLDALDAKIDHNRERVSEKPWQAGLIRTNYINREEVYQAFAMGTSRALQSDRVELSQEQSQVTLDVPDEISIDIPRAWTIMGETAKSFNEHLQWSLEEADRQNLSFGDRLTFLREQGRNWVEDKRQNDPEMFAAWLQMNKHHIQAGEADLVGLPADFTMEDYDSYVKEPFSALV